MKNFIMNIVKSLTLHELLRGMGLTLRYFFQKKLPFNIQNKKHHNHQDLEAFLR